MNDTNKLLLVIIVAVSIIILFGEIGILYKENGSLIISIILSAFAITISVYYSLDANKTLSSIKSLVEEIRGTQKYQVEIMAKGFRRIDPKGINKKDKKNNGGEK